MKSSGFEYHARPNPMSENRPLRPASPEVPSRAAMPGRIEQSIAFMKQHLDQALPAAVLAVQANVSLSHFFAIFKQRTGQTPIAYFIHLRMERARELLEGTALNVKEIAALLGYEDPFYFSRVFKSVAGVAPTEYRHRIGPREAALIPALPALDQRSETAVPMWT